MVTVDPERDTLDVMKNYLESFNQEFIGYRGEVEETVKLHNSSMLPLEDTGAPTEGPTPWITMPHLH